MKLKRAVPCEQPSFLMAGGEGTVPKRIHRPCTRSTPLMYSRYTAVVFTVHRRCIQSTPPLYSKYTATVLTTPHFEEKGTTGLRLFSLKDLENSKEGFIFASEK